MWVTWLTFRIRSCLLRLCLAGTWREAPAEKFGTQTHGVTILRSRADSLRSRRIWIICNYEWVTVALYSAFWISTQVVYLQRCLVVTWLVPRETAACSARSLYIIQPCTMSRHFMQSHIRRVLGCLAVTCRLHFRQNDRDLLRAADRHALGRGFACLSGFTPRFGGERWGETLLY